MSDPLAPDALVSVVVPTYNRADYVGQTVESVLSQTHPNVECIVVDDGSSDDTEGALAPYRDRIVFHRQENRGLAGARNTGIRLARGAWVGFLDSDDLWEPRLIEAALEVLRAHPDAGAIFLAEREIDPRGRPRGDEVHSKRTPGLRFTPEGMIGRDTGVGSGRPPIARKDLLDERGGFDESFRNYAVDCAMWIPWSFDVPMVLLAEPLVLRRVHPGNVSGDQVKDAEAWLRILDRVAAEEPRFCRDHEGLMRRTRAKQHLRIGRELLARSEGDPARVAEARTHLSASRRLWPRSRRAWTYLAWSYLAPRSYGKFRNVERRHR